MVEFEARLLELVSDFLCLPPLVRAFGKFEVGPFKNVHYQFKPAVRRAQMKRPMWNENPVRFIDNIERGQML